MEGREPFGGIGRTGMFLPVEVDSPEGFHRSIISGFQLAADGFALMREREPFRGEQRAGEGAGSGGLLTTEDIERTAKPGDSHKKIRDSRRDLTRGGQIFRRLEFQQMTQSRSGLTQDSVGGIKRGEMAILYASRDIRMVFSGLSMKTLFERFRIEPRPPRLLKNGKMIGHGATGSPRSKVDGVQGISAYNGGITRAAAVRRARLFSLQ
jgi:hypothetical protein